MLNEKSDQYNIHKVGGILLDARKLLVCRSRGKDFFISPGGKIESGETSKEALARELFEEISVKVLPSELSEFDTFFARATGDEDKIIKMEVFMVRNWAGDIKPSSEIEEIAWINSDNSKLYTLGSIFEHEVLPRLISTGLVD